MGDKKAKKVKKVIDKSLPAGEIRWGFLELDNVSGTFEIDQEMIDEHIDELQRQLKDKKSIFAWIQVWNSFAGRFFTSKFFLFLIFSFPLLRQYVRYKQSLIISR
jgi:hypothetical protein